MSFGIRIRELQLRGLNRNYGLKFLAAGRPQPLGIITGEIMTGKTSVLEFIDYCLGAGEHPTHPEIHDAAVRSALLEIEAAGEVRVIERSTFPAVQNAVIHWSSIADLARPHRSKRVPTRPPGDPTSLSHYLLEQVGLAGVRLKEAPAQTASGSDPMSFRDLMWLSFLTTDRLGSKTLLHDNQPMKKLKLRQVIEAVFGVHDELLVDISTSIQNKVRERDAMQSSVSALRRFLDEQSVSTTEDIGTRLGSIQGDLETISGQRQVLDEEMRAASAHNDELREAYASAAATRNSIDTRIRDRSTLRNRMSVLRGQYAADISRLSFSAEAAQLFDPLTVMLCPACQTPLKEAPAIEEERCSLCGQVIAAATGELGIDVDRETRAIETRLDELTRYLTDIDREIETLHSLREDATASERAAQDRLDTAAAPDVAPFLTQLDQLAERRQGLIAQRSALQQSEGLRAGLAQERAGLAELNQHIEDLQQKHALLEEKRLSRDDLVASLSERFSDILRDFGFPKLSDAHLDQQYVPWVRGQRYSQFSSGGMTLIAMAWQLAIFEIATEQQQAHPGFVMIDGLQKNLRPIDAAEDREFGRQEIVGRIYTHLDAWTHAGGRDGQVLIVDNRPPQGATPHLLVTYSGKADAYPYGLIDDATG